MLITKAGIMHEILFTDLGGMPRDDFKVAAASAQNSFDQIHDENAPFFDLTSVQEFYGIFRINVYFQEFNAARRCEAISLICLMARKLYGELSESQIAEIDRYCF